MSGELGQGELTTASNYITCLGLQNSSAKLFPVDTVLVAMYGATVGQVGLLRIAATTNQAVCGIFPSQSFEPKFLFYFMISVKDLLVSQATGNAQPNISQEKIRNVEIPLVGLSEQRRIVGILDQAFEGIAKAKAGVQLCKERSGRILEAAFANHVLFRSSPRLPEVEVRFLAAPKRGAIRTGPFGSQLLHGEFVDEGIAVLGIDNAVANEFKWGKARFITEEKYQSLRRYRVFPGDVIITIMGTCGRCAVIPDDIPIAMNSKHLCCITLDRKKCLPEYLHFYFLYHPVSRDYLTLRAKGSIMAGLNMTIIQELPVVLPSIEKQERIVDDMKAVTDAEDSLSRLYERKLAALDELKQSLLHQAVTGRL